MDDRGLPSNITQKDLEIQRSNLQLQETLTNLDRTISQLSAATRDTNMGAKLDELLQKLNYQYGGDTKKITWEFDKIKSQMEAGSYQELQSQMGQIAQQNAQVLQQLNAVDSQLAAYVHADRKRPDKTTIMADAEAAGQMRLQTQEYMKGNLLKAHESGYFGDSLANPFFAPDIGLNPIQQAMRESRAIMKLSESGSPAKLRKFMEYQRDMFEDSQKAMLNQQVSSALGVRGGISHKGDFEALTLPSISGFAEDIGTSLDEAAMVLKKLRDMRVISQDIRSGAGVEVLNAVDDSSRILQSVGKLIGSTDIKELMTVSKQLTEIGGGDFTRGLSAVKGSSANIIGPFADPAHSISIAAGQASIYSGFFGGNTAASANMGAWDYRTRNLINQYATGEHLNYVGDVTKASDIYMPYMAQRASGVEGWIRHSGGGHDLISGAEVLADQAGGDAVSFYKGMARSMRKASDKQSGTLAEYNLRKEIDLYMSDFGMTREEAELAVFGGNAAAVDAFKEVESAKTAYAKEFESHISTGRFSKIFKPDKDFYFGLWDRQFTDYSTATDANTWELAYGSATSTGTQALADVLVNPLIGLGEMVTRSVPQFHGGSLATYRGLDSLKAKPVSHVETDADFKKKLDDNKSGLMMHIINILNTDRASSEVETVISRVAKLRGNFNFNDIRKILIEGLKDYAYSGMLDDNIRSQILQYISSVTPAQLLKELGPLIDSDSNLYKLLRVGVNPEEVANLLTKEEDFVRVNLVGALKESGWDTSTIEDKIAPKGLLRWTAEALEGSSLMSMGAGIGVSAVAKLALGGAVAGPAGWVASAAVIGASFALPKAVEVAADIIDYTGTIIGDDIDVWSISDVIGAGGADGYTRDIRALLLAVRGYISAYHSGESRTVRVLNSILQQYARAYGIKVQEVMKADPDRSKPRDPLSNEELEAIAKVTVASLPGVDEGIFEGDPTKLVRSVLIAVNSEMSELGKRLRHDPRNINTVIKDVRSAASTVSVGSVGATFSSATASFRNIIEQSSGEIGDVIVAVGAMSNRTQEVTKQLGNIEDMIKVKALDEKQSSAASAIMTSLRAAVEKKDYSLIQELKEEDLDAAKDVLGENTVETLRRLRNETNTDEIRKEIAPLFQSMMQTAESEMEKHLGAARGNVEVFMQMASQIIQSPDAKQKVHQIGKLLRGESV